jgi:DtxR family Mn-dependent transcriptional regulator
MREKLTHAIEDYLKAIYDLTADGERASTNAVAERMGVTPASATGMIQRMAEAEAPLVAYQKHRGVSLTPQGQRAALEVIRLHRLLETFLHQSLGYSWDKVHAEADRLEHVVSAEFIERIDRVLGEPRVDPHGEPIPSKDLDLPHPVGIPLQTVSIGERVAVQCVAPPAPDLLRYLSDIGLIPGAILTVEEVSLFDGNLRLRVEGQLAPLVLGPQVTGCIFVSSVTLPTC